MEDEFMDTTYNISSQQGNGNRFLLLAIVTVLLCLIFSVRGYAQTNNNHLLLSVGALYERGFDASIAYEHGTKYHNAWEYFAVGYIKYDDDPEAGHITKKSFWNNYRSWHVGIAYKPCVSRGRNHHGNARIGVSAGSDTHDFIGGIHVGYEHTYALKHGWEIFFRVKEDVIIPRSGDLFRTGISLGVKMPL